MGKIGFIGFGAMGSIIVKALVGIKAIPEKQIILTTRTPEKLKSFAAQHKKIEVAASIRELAEKSERVFICTGSKEVKPVLEEVVSYLPANAHIITITGMIEIKCIESIFKGRISKIMPTQIAEVGKGVTLVCHNANALPEDREFIKSAFSKVGKVKEIKESQMDLASDLSACAPAFYAATLRSLTDVAQRHGDLSADEIREISLATVYGTAKLLLERDISFTGLIGRVATPGGISEEGVKILDRAMPAVFDEVLSTTLAKRVKIRAQMREQYGVA
jgi:pyrroline-5-carboxylate reductase